MKTIQFICGTNIAKAASELVAAAPAEGQFNDITIRAVPGTTPDDIVSAYEREIAERAAAFRSSEAGLRAAAEDAKMLAAAQATVDAHRHAVSGLDFSDSAAVLVWVEGMAGAADHIGVNFDRTVLRDIFTAWGWPVGVNCGPDFNANDERNFAGYIVGQWLDSWHPMVAGFIGQWRAKFRPGT